MTRASSPPRPPTDRAAVAAELDRIASSAVFGGSARQVRMLRFLVGEVLDGRGGELGARLIATRVFDRPEGFDPTEDSIVRVETSKLRRALDRYNAVTFAPVVRIELPRGSYAPTLLFTGESPGSTRASQSGERPAAGSISQPPPPAIPADEPVLAVLPFAAFSTTSHNAIRVPDAPAASPPSSSRPGARGRALARGLTDQISAVFARYPAVRVVSRAATLEEAAAQGARYVLEGSVRLVHGALRVAAKLHDTARGLQVWGHVYDRFDVGDRLFEIEDEIAREIAREIVAFPYGAVHAIEAQERAGRPARTGYEVVLRLPRWFLSFDPLLQAEIHDTCQRVLAGDPDQGGLMAFLSLFYSLSAWTAGGGEQDRARAADLARRAVTAEGTLAAPHQALALVLLDAGDGRGALAAAETALSLDGPLALTCAAIALAGDWERGTSLLRSHLRVMKRLPGALHHVLALDAYRRGDHAGALAEAEAIATPHLAFDPLDRAVALARLGRLPEARAAGRSLAVEMPAISRAPGAVVARLTADEALRSDLVDALRLAGIG